MSKSKLVARLAAVLAAPAALGAQAMFRGGPEHTGIYQSTNPTLTSVAWKVKIGREIISSPVVAGDAVYVGSDDGNLYSIDRRDGTVRWKFATHGPVRSSPAVADGVVFVGSIDGRI